MSFGKYSDSGDSSARGESYTERFRVYEPPIGSSSGSRRVTDPPEKSKLTRMIERACDPSNAEPNLSLNLEIADYINAKKGNSAREAATLIVKLINSRSSAVSILSLALLDILVKNCGFPFHLQVSRKDFLNELVRKFPERPPLRYSRTQQLILEAIEEWRETICETSRYKFELGYIRDMHRLLAYKGYTFPEINRDDAAVLNPSESIKTAEELEEEERDAKSAKLQELIRRGTPADLLEANNLMKDLAGYNSDHRSDYRARVAEDLAKIQRKAKLLEEMLEGVRSGDAIGRQDAFEELYNAIKNAQTKIQKIIKDESDDEEAVQKLLSLNDFINSVIEKYDSVKNVKRPNSKQSGDLSSPILQGGNNFRTASQATSATNLIDFDDELDSSNNGAMSSQPIFLGSTAPSSIHSMSSSPAPMNASNVASLSGLSELSDIPMVSSSVPAASIPAKHMSNADILAQFSAPLSPTPQFATSALFTTASPSTISPQPTTIFNFDQLAEQLPRVDSRPGVPMSTGALRPIHPASPAAPVTSTTPIISSPSSVSSPSPKVITTQSPQPQSQPRAKTTSQNLLDLEDLL
ncbi:VHS domain-containing protein [Dipodascopsis uninucleata]